MASLLVTTTVNTSPGTCENMGMLVEEMEKPHNFNCEKRFLPSLENQSGNLKDGLILENAMTLF
jgi:hypothetical protein